MTQVTLNYPIPSELVTTYHESAEQSSDLNGEAYSIYDQITQVKLLDSLYQKLLKELRTTVVNFASKANSLMQWSPLNISNLVAFRELEDRILAAVNTANADSQQITTEVQTFLTVNLRDTSQIITQIMVSEPEAMKKVMTNLSNLNTVDPHLLTATKRTSLYESKFAAFDLRFRYLTEAISPDLSETVYQFLGDNPELTYQLVKQQTVMFRNFQIKLRVVKQADSVSELLKIPEIYQVLLELHPDRFSSLDLIRSANLEGLNQLLPDLHLTDLMKQMVKWDVYLHFSNDSQFNNNHSQAPLKVLNYRWFQKNPNWNELTNLRDLMSTVVYYENKFLPQIYLSGHYAVADKSDGVRNWLFINPVGDVYFINVNFQTKLVLPRLTGFYSCLLDGELVQTETGPIFLIFDVLFINNQSFLALPLLSNNSTTGLVRLQSNLLDSLSNALNSQGLINEIKQFQILAPNEGETSSDTFQRLKRVIQNVIEADRPYQTDGVIFSLYQPNYYQIVLGGKYYDQANIKWKPINQLSVDFLVKIKKDLIGNHLITTIGDIDYKQLELYMMDNRKLTLRTVISWPLTKNKQLKCLDMESSELNGDLIYDDSVIECLYGVIQPPHPRDEYNVEWIPIRFRVDKTLYRRPNNRKTVDGVIESSKYSTLSAILPELAPTVNNFQIPPEDLAREGVVDQPLPIKGSVEFGDGFFCQSRIINTYKYQSVYKYLLHLKTLVKFNVVRRAITQMQKTLQRPLNLMELAIGRANDWDIWSGLANIYGFDLDGHNISTINDLLAQPQGIFTKHKETHGLQLQVKQLDLIQWRKQREMIQALPKMDIITCHFALHFFTGKREDLTSLLELILDRLQPGGKLIISTFDGQKINELLQRNVAAGYIDNDLLWQMTRDPSLTNQPAQIFGNSVNSTIVPLCGYRTIRENLVLMDNIGTEPGIKTIFRERGLNLRSDQPFSAFINQTEIDYYTSAEHSIKPSKVDEIVQGLDSITNHPVISVLVDYHHILVWRRGSASSP